MCGEHSVQGGELTMRGTCSFMVSAERAHITVTPSNQNL